VSLSSTFYGQILRTEVLCAAFSSYILALANVQKHFRTKNAHVKTLMKLTAGNIVSHIVEKVKTSTTMQVVYQRWNLKLNTSAGTKVCKAYFESEIQSVGVIPIADESGDFLLWRYKKFEKIVLSRHTESKCLWVREIVTSKFIMFLEMSRQFILLRPFDERFPQLFLTNLVNGKGYEFQGLYREFDQILSAKMKVEDLLFRGERDICTK